MYAPLKEIITSLLKHDMASDEALLVLCITRADIRFHTTDWNLSEEDITCIMQRLDVTYQNGADVSMIHHITEEMMDERRAIRDVSVPVSALQKIMLLADIEMQRLYAVAEDGGGNIREEQEAMRAIRAALDA
ncbi:hypothetical protein DOH76_27790 [Salmonella enterica subsp. enterica serovar Oranienburg]|nr:DUF1380 domain-containing protein [Salmonella enterica]EBG5027592.1 DUF1380 domain-containing protein [Salmonella enterica subsp. enterica serovar Oranienburg]EAS1265583.1 DUF1380 domain-containing protein [Salmonella enterica]EBB1608120.1 DUF1380 domain-containing protein [Salmonella enterica]EBB9534906.1 DUF1380 domain-containing protein [Salmonella enterica]